MKKYQKQNGAYFVSALVFIFISNAFAVILQFFKGDVLDYAIAGETQTTIKYAVLLIVFILGEILFYFGYKQFSARFVVGCTKLLKRDIFESIIQRGYVDFKQLPQGEYIAKYTNEADTIKARQFQMLPLFWDILFMIIFVSIALFVLDWRIALITIGLLTTPLYIPKLIEKRLQTAQTEYLKAVETNLAKVNDWLSGFEIIKNFSIERKIISKFDEVNDLTMKKLLRDTTLGAVSQLITTLISYLSYFVVLVFATWLVLKGDFSAGNFFVAIGMIDQLSYPLISLAEIIRQLVAIRPSCRSMEAFIAEGRSKSNGRPLTALTNGISYRDVTFGYAGEKPILRHFNFDAQRDKRYLIKGPSGCGKTTAVNLLLRYFDVNDGSIEIDGVPISEYGSTYDCMTVVRQEAVLFHDSLRNNLTMYSDISDGTLIEMLDGLGLNKFANVDALEQEITENGSNLSGGEKKRICLARALLRNTDVLILDEPLANLDEATAGKIEDLLLSIKNKLLLVVSHQFTEEKTKQFDQVLVMDKS
ncbi:MAG: ABC transporter ATP-binding protein [Lachnospiraceae bacterium]|nr:ABC transporter ATP-binding protein [Lachnospiraceae bacterium]